MLQRKRVTLTLPAEVVAEARAASRGNLSRFVTDTLRKRLERIRRHELRKALIEGCIAEAELDLAICKEWAYVDWETTQKYWDGQDES